MTAARDHTVDARFFGPLTPYATIATRTSTALLFIVHCPIAVLVTFTLFWVSPLIMLAGPGRTRQICTGMAVSYTAIAATVGLVLLVDYLRTDVWATALAA